MTVQPKKSRPSVTTDLHRKASLSQQQGTRFKYINATLEPLARKRLAEQHTDLDGGGRRAGGLQPGGLVAHSPAEAAAIPLDPAQRLYEGQRLSGNLGRLVLRG